MTPLFLLCYIIYTTITSTTLSLLLGLLLLRRISALPTSEEIGNVIALYEGTVYHARRHPAHNSFRFPARYALIDLDRPPYSPPHYLSADDARRAAKTTGPVYYFFFYFIFMQFQVTLNLLRYMPILPFKKYLEFQYMSRTWVIQDDKYNPLTFSIFLTLICMI